MPKSWNGGDGQLMRSYLYLKTPVEPIRRRFSGALRADVTLLWEMTDASVYERVLASPELFPYSGLHTMAGTSHGPHNSLEGK